jgi:NADH-quinone oxidoreductase subunit F
MLHAFHDRDGTLSESAIRSIAAATKTPLAELYGTVTFYHHLSRGEVTKDTPRVCVGPVCLQRGGQALLQSLASEGAIPIACPGRCDDPVPVIRGDRVEIVAEGSSEDRPSPLPPVNPAGQEECVFSAIRASGRKTIEGYHASGGYAGLGRAIEMGPAAVIQTITDARLAGKGGAGFPTGQKWRAVRDASGEPKSVVCNADEGEPGCFQDRVLLDHDPHALIEGMVIAGLATGATQGFIYLRYEYPYAHSVILKAIEEAQQAGILGDSVLGSGVSFQIHLRRGGGAYICGEETSLLNSLEGKHPYPRNRPPYPVTHGYNDLPTAVNNVETLAVVPQILVKGAEWHVSLGMGEHAGTKVISVSGDVKRPGNYEIPVGLPLRTLLDEWAGGAPDGRAIQAVTMAGVSGGFLAGDDLDVPLDASSVGQKGALLGAAGIMVFDDSRDVVEVARSVMHFFSEESCGKCFPCRIGTRRLYERLDGSDGPNDPANWRKEVDDMTFTMKATSACGLGQAAPLIIESLDRYFPDKVTDHVKTSHS